VLRSWKKERKEFIKKVFSSEKMPILIAFFLLFAPLVDVL